MRAGHLSGSQAETIKTVALTRNVLAHAYRRLGAEDLNSIVDRLLPKVETLIREGLLKLLEAKKIDPSKSLHFPEEASKVFFRNGISFAYLFGSRARGTAREDSDYDLAVLFKTSNVTVMDEVKLAKELAEVLEIPADKVDVTSLNRADPSLLTRIFREGILVYTSSLDEQKKWEREVYLNLLRQADLNAIYTSKTIRSSKPRKN